MAGRPRQPIELVELKGRKHLTKAEIERRRSTEVKPAKGRITPPAYLSKPQKTKFRKLSAQLVELGIFGATDAEALAKPSEPCGSPSERSSDYRGFVV